jgi:Patatin-like phospholipase
MKGGITSGVVYPAAVSELKDSFRFCSIGGASAGAIAAAVTAAAQFGRDRSSDEASCSICSSQARRWRSSSGSSPIYNAKRACAASSAMRSGI